MSPRTKHQTRELESDNSFLPKRVSCTDPPHSHHSSKPPTNDFAAPHCFTTPPTSQKTNTTPRHAHHRYTSLGERGDTAKNEALRLPDGGYRPAYELAEQEEHLERAPRTPVASPRSPTRGSGSGDGGDGEDGGDGGGVGGAGGDGQKRFSSWDEKWDALDVDSAHDGTSAAAFAAGGARSGAGAGAGAGAVAGAGAGRGGIISGDARSSEGGSVLMGIASNTIGGIACRLPDGSKAPGGSGGGVGGALTGWVGSWLPLTTIVVALVLAALGVRSSSGSSRGGEYDSPPDKD